VRLGAAHEPGAVHRDVEGRVVLEAVVQRLAARGGGMSARGDGLGTGEARGGQAPSAATAKRFALPSRSAQPRGEGRAPARPPTSFRA